MPKPAARRAYKEIQLQQLRSFCETARLGSLTAAARSLGLSQPTVWEQVHALERELGVSLIERHARGCRLTEEGRRVVALAAPLVQGVRAFQRSVAEALLQETSQLTIATTQRILVEDLPRAIVEFERAHQQVQLRLLELRIEQVPQAVESGQADLGFTTEQGTDRRNPWLALAMTIGLLSLGGIPPAAGFFGKLFLFQAAVNAQLVGLAVIGVLNAIVGLYYYLVIIKTMYVDHGQDEDQPLPVPRAHAWAMGIAAVVVIILGVIPAPVFDWAIQGAEAVRKVIGG